MIKMGVQNCDIIEYLKKKNLTIKQLIKELDKRGIEMNEDEIYENFKL